VKAWNRFWFAPAPAAPLAVVRIAFGVVITIWTATLAVDGGLSRFFEDDGILPHPRYGVAPALWSVLRIWPSDHAVVIAWVVLLLACVLLTIGLFTRVAALVVFVGVMSFERRNPFIFNSGDGLLRIIALYLVFAPAGAYLSMDRLRKARERFWETPDASVFALRLMQIQLSFLYLGSVWAKLSGASWNDGTAISYALRVGDLHRFPYPGFLSSSQLMSNLATYGTLAIESALAVLVWNRRLRPWVLGAGVLLHAGISYGLRVGYFSVAVFTLYLAFLSPAAAQRVCDAIRGLIGDDRNAAREASPAG